MREISFNVQHNSLSMSISMKAQKFEARDYLFIIGDILVEPTFCYRNKAASHSTFSLGINEGSRIGRKC